MFLYCYIIINIRFKINNKYILTYKWAYVKLFFDNGHIFIFWMQLVISRILRVFMKINYIHLSCYLQDFRSIDSNFIEYNTKLTALLFIDKVSSARHQINGMNAF